MKKIALFLCSLTVLAGAGCGNQTTEEQPNTDTPTQEQPVADVPVITFADAGENLAPQWLRERMADEFPNEHLEWYPVDDPELDGVTFVATSYFDISTKSVTNRIYRYTDSDDDFEVLWDEIYQPGDFTFEGFGDYEAPVFRLLGVEKNGEQTRLIGLAQWYSDSPAPCSNPLAFEESEGRKYFALDVEDPDELLPAPEFDQTDIDRADGQLEDCRTEFEFGLGN